MSAHVARAVRGTAICLALLLSSVCAFGAPGAGDAPAPGALSDNAPVVVRAAALTAQAQSAATTDECLQTLDAARQLLEKFLREQPTHPDGPQAEMQLGIVLTTRGQQLVAKSKTTNEPAQTANLVADARDTFRSAERSFSTAIERIRGLIEAFPTFIEAGDPALAQREALKGSLLQVLIYQAAVVEELAATFPPESSDYRDNYQAAADRYERVYKDYRTLLVGLMARLRQGQCYHRLGDTRRALGLYNDVLTQPADLEPLRRLRVTAMFMSLEGWTGEHEKMYELAFSQGEEYLTEQRPEEKAWPEWQAVQFYTAQGYRLAADALPPARAADRDAWRTQARAHLEPLMSSEGPYREDARRLAAAWESRDAGR